MRKTRPCIAMTRSFSTYPTTGPVKQWSASLPTLTHGGSLAQQTMSP